MPVVNGAQQAGSKQENEPLRPPRAAHKERAHGMGAGVAAHTRFDARQGSAALLRLLSTAPVADDAPRLQRNVSSMPLPNGFFLQQN